MFHHFFLPELTLSEYFEKKIIDEEKESNDLWTW